MLARGANATIVGAGIGTAGALVLMRVLESMLFGVTSHDAATFIAAPLTLLMVSLVACSVPAWRATKMNPVTVLRSE